MSERMIDLSDPHGPFLGTLVAKGISEEMQAFILDYVAAAEKRGAEARDKWWRDRGHNDGKGGCFYFVDANAAEKHERERWITAAGILGVKYDDDPDPATTFERMADNARAEIASKVRERLEQLEKHGAEYGGERVALRWVLSLLGEGT